LDSERRRRSLFKDGVPPDFVADPPPHLQMRLDALNALREQKQDAAVELFDRAD